MGTMTDRVGVLSWRPTADGRFLLALWDGRAELVEPGLADDELAVRFALDRIVHAPEIDFCAAIHLDGPLAGTLGSAVNRMGFQVGFALAPRPGGLTGTYEVVKLSQDGQLAELRFIR